MVEIIVDKNITLKPVTINDAADMFEYAQDKELTKFLPWEPHKDIEETKFVISNFFNYDEKNPNFGVFYNGKLVGTCGSSHPQPETTLELGYTISRKFQNKGIVTKASKAFFEWAETKGFEKVIARVLDGNESSIAVMKKLGFFKTDEVLDRDGIKGPLYVLELN